MSKDTLELLLDSMERNNMRLVCGNRQLQAEMADGKYLYWVWETNKRIRNFPPKRVYKGNDFYAAMLALEGENPI